MQVVRRAKVHSCGDDGVDLKVTTERLLSPEDLGAVILGCTTATYNEYITNKHFGLPFTQIKYVERIEEGLPIFLFNFSEREMHGIFEAVRGAVNVDPGAWGSPDFKSRPTFPATVSVRARKDWPIVSLPESVFKEAIIDNYYSYTRFYFELDHKQADELVDLFMRQTIISPRHISNSHAIDRLSTPHTDVHVVYRETLTSENILFGEYCVPERYDSCELQSESAIAEKPVAQEPCDWDNYSTSLSSESFSFACTHDPYDTSLFDTPRCGYVPVQEDAITFRLDKVAGKDMIEAGTFSFHHEAPQAVMSNSDADRKGPKSTEEEDPSTNTTLDFEVADNVGMEEERRTQQRDDSVSPRIHFQHPGQEEEAWIQCSEGEGAISSPPRHDEEDAQQTGESEESVSFHPGYEEEYLDQLGEGFLFIRPKVQELHQQAEIAPRFVGHEQDQRSTHHSFQSGGVQEVSTSLRTANDPPAVVSALTGIKRDRDQGSKVAARALSKGNYGAMFSWASEVTRFLSSRGHASRNAERRECRQFLGKLRRLKIMRDESQAQALVHQIQALRVKPAKEEFFDFRESYEVPNEEHPCNSIDESGNMGRHPSAQDQSFFTKQEEDLDSQIAGPDTTSPTKANDDLEQYRSGFPQPSQDEVQFWRSEWMKEAKWRLEDYEHMQNTMFLLENARVTSMISSTPIRQELKFRMSVNFNNLASLAYHPRNHLDTSSGVLPHILYVNEVKSALLSFT